MTALIHFPIVNLLGIITFAIWLHLFFGRGWFWRVRKMDADRSSIEAVQNWPSVVAIVPARNEAETIQEVLTSLVRQDYPGKFSIVIVDDHSEDATASIANQVSQESGTAAQVVVLSAAELQPGWTGKLSALNSGVSAIDPRSTKEHGVPEAPAYYWFTDADISHAPDTLRGLMSHAEQDELDLASLMVLLQAKTLPERALIPAFLYFFLMLYPPKWTTDEDLGTAGAAGGCILLKREALARVGGLAAIRSEVIDDCALAKAVKQTGGKVWMGLTRKSVSLRNYDSFTEIQDLVARTAFTQLRYSPLLLAGTLAGMLLTYISPIALLFAPDPTAKILGLAAWVFMSFSFLPTVRFYRLSPLWAPLLPAIAAFYTYATYLSAVRYWRGKGGQWKGRSQARKAA
jgi:hopene-associated glycosyltransferase HpnB